MRTFLSSCNLLNPNGYDHASCVPLRSVPSVRVTCPIDVNSRVESNESESRPTQADRRCYKPLGHAIKHYHLLPTLVDYTSIGCSEGDYDSNTHSLS